MNLSKALDDHNAPLRGGHCTICKILDELPEADAKALREALADRDRFSGASIERLLRAEGLQAGTGAANRHRRAECR